MGHIVHHAIIVTTWDEDRAEAARAEAKRIGCLSTPLTRSQTNGYLSFLIVPDGSKSGWSNSASGDAERGQFVEYLKRDEEYYEWVEVEYGEDNSEAKITRSRWPRTAPEQTQEPVNLKSLAGLVRSIR